MKLGTLDWIIIALFFLVSLIIGLRAMRKASTNAEEFFLSGRSMPWWLLGVSMVATTFAADTPNLVTDIVRKDGIAGNWIWWAFLLTGMMTVFIYSRLWRRSGVLTDLGFYELRYSGKEARFLRGFRAVYLGFVFNVITMAAVCLAAIKISGVMLGFSPIQTIIVASIVTVVYSGLGGLRGVIQTDFIQFAVAMIGSVWATWYIVNMPEIGGMENLLHNGAVADKLNFIPRLNPGDEFIYVFIIPLAVQWWSVWYPGAEPGGGGYIAQRMLAAKNERHAIGATLLFNIAHYALRPWPWIIVALASLVVYPTLTDLQQAFPDMPADKVKDDLAYPAMMALLPAGLIGLVLASLIAAFMSTISTHLNWGSSYLVNDFYVRFIRPGATDKEQVKAGRLTTVVLMAVSGLLALWVESAKDVFSILLQMGAGTGLIFILRWFWWRINAYTEIAGMVISFLVAIGLKIFNPDWSEPMQLVFGVGVTTAGWLIVTLLTPPTDKTTLRNYFMKIRPFGRGWKRHLDRSSEVFPKPGHHLSADILMMVLGVFSVYAMLFGIGNALFGKENAGFSLLALAAIGLVAIWCVWKKAYGDEEVKQ